MKLSLTVNRLCNLRCTYCYTGEKVNKRMSEETMRRAVDFALEHDTQGWLLLAFFGGEPLLEPELMVESLSYARTRCAQTKKQLHTALTTNGTLLDDAKVELLRKHGFRVKVSLDGGQAAQDATRRTAGGQSSWSTASAGLSRLLAAGVHTTVGAVIDPANVHLLGDSLDDLVALGARHVTFAPNYSGDWTEAARERCEDALDELGDRYAAQLRRGVDVRVDPLAGKIITHLDPRSSARAICHFGLSEVAVGPSGRLYPCDRMVNEDDDDSVCIGHLDSGLDLKKRDSLLPSRREELPMCRECPVKSRCRRFCGCANYETSGDPGRVSDIVCWFEQAFIDAADRVGNALFTEQNPLFLKNFYPAARTADVRAAPTEQRA